MMKKSLVSQWVKAETEHWLSDQSKPFMQGFFKNLQQYLYPLLLFFFPTQLGKHFWPSFTFVSGLRIDYLSPTLYVTDVLLLLLFLCVYFSKEFSFPKILPLSKGGHTAVILFIGIVCMGILFSKSPDAGWFGLLKLMECVFFGWYTKQFFTNNKRSLVVFSIAWAVLLEAVLAIMQFFAKGSIDGIWYFFGERTFSTLTPGIANASIGGQLVLRPYGTLPHPNVLAAFLLISLIFLSVRVSAYSSWLWKLFLSSVFCLGTVALFLTLSRITLVVFFCCIVYGVWTMVGKTLSKKTIGFILVIGVVFFVGIFLTPVVGRFTSSSLFEESFLIREDLTKNALWMIWTHPLLGVGLQNFLQNLPSSHSAYAFYTLLQPVHNIYLLTFAELGITGGLFFVFFLYNVFMRIQKAKSSTLQKSALVLFVSMLFLGLFDHYFLSVQQGRLLFSFVLGLCFALPNKNVQTRKNKV